MLKRASKCVARKYSNLMTIFFLSDRLLHFCHSICEHKKLKQHHHDALQRVDRNVSITEMIRLPIKKIKKNRKIKLR